MNNVLGFTDIEHYSVYRGRDETHPVAEMTVKDTYRKGVGKTYTILSQSGSGIVMRFGLKPLLDNEESINKPGNVEKSWFTSANYEMKLKPGGSAEAEWARLLRSRRYCQAESSQYDRRNAVGGRRDRRNRPARWNRVQEPFSVCGNDAHDAAIYAVGEVIRWPRMRARSRTACSLGGR